MFRNKLTMISGLIGMLPLAFIQKAMAQKATHPNIVFIYADDLGFGDISCNGSATIKTPNIDQLAQLGLRFTNAHCSSGTCTPSRYSMLTGEYAWRRKDTEVAAGDAGAIIKPGTATIASVLKKVGYTTGLVGKWHLGLGPQGGPDWNGEITSSPMDIGFDYNFMIPATGDRVPCVFVENRKVANLDPNDPITVSYTKKIANEPTGKENPELLRLHPSSGHADAIVNGIGRIGFMTGGKSALWVDEDIADVITKKAVDFIEKNKKSPFYLYFSTHDIHTPRVPHQRFVGKSGMGTRGDAILQFDWSVGEIMKKIDQLELSENTIIIVTSDNGGVVQNGYADQSVELLGKHQPNGIYRGGKNSRFEGGTRVAFIACWKGRIRPGTSDALISQVDLLASFAHLTGQQLAKNEAPDSYNYISSFLGDSKTGREWLVEHAGKLAIIQGKWKYIEPSTGGKINKDSKVESANDPLPQLYNLETDPGEKSNLALKYPDVVKELSTRLEKVRNGELNRLTNN